MYRIARVADGDTVDLTTGQRVRLVQIDTPAKRARRAAVGESRSIAKAAACPGGNPAGAADETVSAPPPMMCPLPSKMTA